MKITTTARHYDLTPALKDYAEKKVYNLKKYFDHIVNAHITFSMEKYRHVVEVSVHVNGKDFNGREESEDMYASVDKVVDKLERQILKYKGKRMKRKPPSKLVEVDYRFQEAETSRGETNEEEPIPARLEEFPRMTMEQALANMRSNGSPFNIFTEDGRSLKILYRREDGKIGVIVT